MKLYLNKLFTKHVLSQQECYQLIKMLNFAPIEQQAAVLTLLQSTNLTHEQLIGVHEALFEHSQNISCPYDVIDIVGTGGDNIGTFNISTAASIVVASCGVYVAKHGGKSITSQSGSADVLNLLGIPSPETNIGIHEQLKKHQFVYLSSGLFNPLFQYYRDLRKKLGFPSILNIVAPLLNPLRPKRTVIGVYQKSLIEPMILVLKNLNYTHALVVHSHDGLDELSISAPTDIAELNHGDIKLYTLNPSDLGLKQADLCSVLGGSPKDNAQTVTQILIGELEGPKRDIVLLNAAAGLLVSNKVQDFISGIDMAKQALITKKTASLFTKLQKTNNHRGI